MSGHVITLLNSCASVLYALRTPRAHGMRLVTMAVSAAILDIFNVKEWPDLEMWVWGPPRSLKMARFDRTCITSC